jgi:hypothetical protein
LATKLGLFNQALHEIGEVRLATATDAVKARYTLDDVYAGALAECLQAGLWNFAMRTTQEDSDATPSIHAFAYQFTLPTDFVRIAMLSDSDTFNPPLVRYEVEAGVLYADADPLYLKHVSDNASYGGDLTAFPALYEKYAVAVLAGKIVKALTGSESERIRIDTQTIPRAFALAKSADAMDNPPRFFRPGRWSTARAGGRVRDRIGGNLTG